MGTSGAGESGPREAELDTIVELIRLFPTACALFDADMRYLALSDGYRQAYRLGDREVLGMSHYEVFPDLPERFREAHRRALAGTPQRSELDHFAFDDGAVRWRRWECRPWFDASGKVVRGMMLTVEDTTEAVVAQQALERSERRFRSAMEGSPIGMAIVALDGRFKEVNPAFADMLGYSVAELTATDFQAVTHPDDLEADLAFVRQLLNGQHSTFRMTKRYRHKRGHDVHAQLHVSLLRHPNGEPWHFVSQIVDISEQVKSDLARRESEERLRIIAETVREVFWLSSVDKARFLYVSQSFERVWGLTVEALIHHPMRWLELVHPDDRDRVAAAAMRQAEGSYDEVYRIVRPDGVLRWIHDRAFPVLGEGGTVERIAGVAEDITERRRIEEQYQASQRMEAIGQLAGGVAHDFNNMLAIILLHVSAARDHEDLPAEVQESLDDIDEAAQRAAKLTRQLLQLSRRGVLQTQRVDLNDVVRQLMKIFHRTLGESIEVREALSGSVLDVMADPSNLEQVMTNLVLNARDAMPRGGRLIVETGESELSHHEVGPLAELAPGPYVWLRVSDSGEGIRPEALPRVFEPFFTTKGGQGTGLGLATVFGVVRQHKGAVTVHSTPGLGTSFQVLLPRVVQSPVVAAPDASPGPEPTRGGHERILLVEDDPVVRKVTRLVLEREGYQVVAAEHGREALEVYGRLAGEIDLLLTDLVMPGGLTGRDLAARLQAIDPRLAIIMVSGYSPDIFGRSLELDPNQVFLMKPVSRQALLAQVRASLDARMRDARRRDS